MLNKTLICTVGLSSVAVSQKNLRQEQKQAAGNGCDGEEYAYF